MKNLVSQLCAYNVSLLLHQMFSFYYFGLSGLAFIDCFSKGKIKYNLFTCFLARFHFASSFLFKYQLMKLVLLILFEGQTVLFYFSHFSSYLLFCYCKLNDPEVVFFFKNWRKERQTIIESELFNCLQKGGAAL